jgi:hypothetical protein
VLDDYSRLLVASWVFVTAKAADVVESFHQGVAEVGPPASMLTDIHPEFCSAVRVLAS